MNRGSVIRLEKLEARRPTANPWAQYFGTPLEQWPPEVVGEIIFAVSFGDDRHTCIQGWNAIQSVGTHAWQQFTRARTDALFDEIQAALETWRADGHPPAKLSPLAARWMARPC